ncbi:MAG: ABC transporter permease subunit [Nitrospiraceae bacterium]|nr:ABC transporter permease subunit [Nitrospiraceae bacterium]
MEINSIDAFADHAHRFHIGHDPINQTRIAQQCHRRIVLGRRQRCCSTFLSRRLELAPDNLILALLDSTRVFRLARAVALNVVVMDFVEAARLRGEKLPWIVFKEIIPNILPPLITEFGLRFCSSF